MPFASTKPNFNLAIKEEKKYDGEAYKKKTNLVAKQGMHLPKDNTNILDFEAYKKWQAIEKEHSDAEFCKFM